MYRAAAAVVFCVLLAANAFAGFSQTQNFHAPTASELAMKDVPSAPGAAAVILEWVEVDNDAESFAAEYYRIKILTEDGKKYADVEVPYFASYPLNGRVVDISARTIQPDGKIIPFDGKVYDKVLYKSGGMRLRAKTFSLPAVQVGSILEYRYQRRWNDMMLVNTLWSMQREIPILRARMSLRPMDTEGMFRSFFTYNNLPPGKLPKLTDDYTYDFELTDIPAFQSEELAPPEESLKPRVNFYYTASRVEPDKFWTAQSSAWNKSIEGFIGKVQPNPSLAGATPVDTLRNIYAKVQTFKNLSYEDETTAKDKKNAAQVIEKAEGYRSEINRAFVALARAAGLEANVVRVAPRDRFFFRPNIPDAEQMDGEIAAVTLDGKVQYFDPGTPTAPFGVVSWEKSNVPGLRIAKNGPPDIGMHAVQGTDQALMRRSADLKLEADVLAGTVTATFSGQEALIRRLRTWGEDEATRTKDLEDEAKEWFPAGATVKLTALTGDKTHTDPLVAKFDVTLPGLVSAAGSRTVLPISVFASTAKNPFASATRTHPIYVKFPRREEDEVKVALPEGTSLAEVPPPARLDAGALKYNNEVKKDGAAIVFVRTMSVDTMIVDPQYYRGMRNFYSSMVAADQKPLVLVSK